MNIQFDPDDLRPLVQQIVAETLAATNTDIHTDDGRLAWSEAEAAAMLGLETHVLREQRRKGRIVCCNAKPGRRILYRREQIDAFLNGENQDE